ncbi:MAG: transcriptional regulator PadR family protein [Gemmatimonadetes bacterium]|nr:transcriptional regulator PadR family protein [Gemmatimonadota bacterium]
MSARPLSVVTIHVLGAIAAGERYGFSILDAAELPSGTVYPILSRLEKTGLVRGTWEPPSVAQRERRPGRRYYEITAGGSRELARSIEYYRTVGGGRKGPLVSRPSRG